MDIKGLNTEVSLSTLKKKINSIIIDENMTVDIKIIKLQLLKAELLVAMEKDTISP